MRLRGLSTPVSLPEVDRRVQHSDRHVWSVSAAGGAEKLRFCTAGNACGLVGSELPVWLTESVRGYGINAVSAEMADPDGTHQAMLLPTGVMQRLCVESGIVSVRLAQAGGVGSAEVAETVRTTGQVGSTSMGCGRRPLQQRRDRHAVRVGWSGSITRWFDNVRGSRCRSIAVVSRSTGLDLSDARRT